MWRNLALVMHSRRYSAFISYRHADNTQEGRRWAEWLHRALERYTVPPDLIGTPNLRGEPIRDSLYPIFRDEDELPANADLATGIRAALEVSDHLIVLCSPRSAVSPWVRKEVREFKELGRSDRILAIIIAGEPNADDPAKARDGILRDEECFCEELRFGAVGDDGTLDWTIRTEPLAADLRPIGTRAEGFVTAEAYREHLTLNSSLTLDKITARAEAYRQQLDHGLIKVIAGLLGVPLGQLKDRDAAHRTALAEAEAAKQRDIAKRERQLAEQAQRSAEEARNAKLATERIARRLAIAGAGALVLALLAGWFWWQATQGKAIAVKAQASAEAANEKTKAALFESALQLERSQLEEGRAWFERAKAAQNRGDRLSAVMLAGRAIGYEGCGRFPQESPEFAESFPLLLAKPMNEPKAEKARLAEFNEVITFLGQPRLTPLPLWCGAMEASVSSTAFSPDGSRFASGSFDKTIKLWDAASGKELASFSGHSDRVSSIAFSPDGTRLASGSFDKTIKLWDAASGKELASFSGHSDRVSSVAFSPDGTRLASGSFDKTIKLWDAASGKELLSLSGHSYRVSSVAFSPDGTRLASGSDDTTIKLWDTASGKELGSLSGHSNQETTMSKGVSSVAYSSFGNRFACGSFDKTIKLWDTTSGKELAPLLGHMGPVFCVAFNSDGTRLASGSSDKTIKLWDTTSGKELASISGHSDSVTSIVFSPDGNLLVSGSMDKNTKLWEASPKGEIASLAGHTDQVCHVLFSPDCTRLASGSHDKTIKLWDAASGKELASLLGHKGSVWKVAFSPDGSRLASGSHDKTIKLWDAASGKELTSLLGHSEPVFCVAFSPDGTRLASGSFDNTIKLWDPSSGRELASLAGLKSLVFCVTFSPDGSRLAAGFEDKTIKLWDLPSGKELASFNEGTGIVLRVAFSPDGNQLASSAMDTSFKLWDINSGKELPTDAANILKLQKWLASGERIIDTKRAAVVTFLDKTIIHRHSTSTAFDLAIRLRNGLLALPGYELKFPENPGTTEMIPSRNDTYAQLGKVDLTPAERAELQMLLCTKSGQFRAAIALWHRLLQGEWPGIEGAIVPKDQAPATIPADSAIRRLYLLALIDATKHSQIHGHPTICQTAAQIAPVLTKEMMATPTISLAMMSLMQTLAKDANAAMNEPRVALMKKLEEVATKEWLAVLREGK